MCGIFFYLNKDGSRTMSYLFEQFMKIKHRGPDFTSFSFFDNIAIGFHRLAINDLTQSGNQPMVDNDVVLICNGEIYNYKMLNEKFKLNCRSHSDCETILQLYHHLNTPSISDDSLMYELCNNLDGEFAFVLYDIKKKKVYAARDPFGVRPLFIGYNESADCGDVGFASELKALDKIFVDAHQFFPGTYMAMNIGQKKEPSFIVQYYYQVCRPLDLAVNTDLNVILPMIKKCVTESVLNRMSTLDRPFCALLSGGLDSSLVCGILAKNSPNPINTFSIGMSKDSTDLEYARVVARHIKSIHHEVILSAEDMLEAIEEVIYAIESYDITTVRASIPHFLLAKHIREHTDFKVVFTGEMSDEQFGGYLYFKKAPDAEQFHEECNRLLEEVCYFDNLRADRCISGNGLEARVPFADTTLISFVQSIDPELRMCNDKKIEKYLLRKAFEDVEDPIIPSEVLYRQKEAFSDGISKQTKKDSWYKILQTHINKLVTDEEFLQESIKINFCTPDTKESYYYRKIFEKHYSTEFVIPHFWRPKWTKQKDPSARELFHYNS